MIELYILHDKYDYEEVKAEVFILSAVEDAIKLVHDRISEQLASYKALRRLPGQQEIKFGNSVQCYQVSLYLRAKTALLNRKIVSRTPLDKITFNSVNELEEKAHKEVEKIIETNRHELDYI